MPVGSQSQNIFVFQHDMQHLILWYNIISGGVDIIHLKKELDKNKHSVYLLYFHLVLVVKYRRKVIDDEISAFLKSEFIRLGEPRGIVLEEWNHDYDHVHIMFRSVPNVDLTKIIMSYKSVSSRFVKQKYPRVKQMLWKDVFWSRSYCLLTSGGAATETIRKYIHSQGKNK